ncbi:hypothetical protein chiPu_0026331 [Chiloscyllium punctatum]|uniref:Uncharacterized protein n=1 Tax=Chiloscyllium punctatum TaxID=137246 RepID=A0A401THX1_CHIPU|nr:hypothetical protein [Chiloscyllium punctatum]
MAIGALKPPGLDWILAHEDRDFLSSLSDRLLENLVGVGVIVAKAISHRGRIDQPRVDLDDRHAGGELVTQRLVFLFNLREGILQGPYGAGRDARRRGRIVLRDLGVDGIDRLERAVISSSPDGSAIEFVERLFGQAGVGDRGRFPHRRLQHIRSEQVPQQRDDLRLRNVVRIVARDDIANEVMVEASARLLNHGHEVRRHKEELAHGRDVDHLGMDRHEHGGSGVERSHGEVAKLRRTVDYDDVVIVGDLVDRRRQATKEKVMAALATLDHGSRRVVLELHQFEIARH